MVVEEEVGGGNKLVGRELSKTVWKFLRCHAIHHKVSQVGGKGEVLSFSLPAPSPTRLDEISCEEASWRSLDGG